LKEKIKDNAETRRGAELRREFAEGFTEREKKRIRERERKRERKRNGTARSGCPRGYKR
jgi:hypothetical protein